MTFGPPSRRVVAHAIDLPIPAVPTRSHAAMTARLRLGFDIGGTFTDFVLADPDTGALRLHKRLTTPEDPATGALEGLRRIVADHGARLEDVADIVHGTTLVTNAVIERKGAALGLITTAGFRDVLEAGTEQRYDIYDLFLTFPEPLVPRRRRLEVRERMDRDGRVVTPLDREGVRRAALALREAGAEAIAICFINAYREPRHEREAAAIVAEALPGMPVSVSSDVVAEIGEYARTVTTCANAYVQPLMATYLRRLERELREAGFAGHLRLMHSAGGLLSLPAARDFPVRLLESGPAGGALAAALLGARAGHADLLAFDMGGTTAKACLVEDGRAQIAPLLEAGREHRFKKGSGLPVKAPTVDMIEIGAGGGSIARLDEVGLLRVGPDSAGAAPGPACYGRGGLEPTVTDANLVLGYYDPGFFLGGTMALDVSAARAAIGRVAEPLGLSVEQAAWGIHKVVVESMADAARVYLVERGKDPRRYAMVGFGGAGPAHAAEVARALGMRELVVPPASGAASALGFLAAPPSASRVRSLPVRLDSLLDLDAIESVLRALEAEAREELASGGVREGLRAERSADMRLLGQMHEIAVPLPATALEPGSLPALLAAFEAAYVTRYAALQSGAQVEAVNFRVTVSGPKPELTLGEGGRVATPARKGERRAWFGDGFATTAVYDRYALPEGVEVAGPAIVEEREATTVVAPGDTLRVDAAGNLRIAIGEASAMDLVRPGMSQAQARAAIEADPIALEIMWSRLVTVVDEMWLTICRTAFSLIIAEIPGLRLRAAGPPRRDAGALAARHAGVQPHPAARGEGAAGALPGGHAAARRHAGDQRPLAVRGAPVRHRGGDAGVPRGPRGGAGRHGRARGRHRRHARQPARARDLRGGAADPAHEAGAGRGGERGPVRAHREQRAQPRAGDRRRARLHVGQPDRGAAPAGLHGRVRAGRPRGAGQHRAGPRGAGDARGGARAAGRHLREPRAPEPGGRGDHPAAAPRGGG